MTDPTNLPPDPASALLFRTGAVTPTEAAAVSAVLSGLQREESDQLGHLPEGSRSAWQTSQRAIRSPVIAGQGHWRSFPV